MSSPAASTSGDRARKPAEQITFRFCSECSNMLYPKEDEVERKLMFTCRTCNFSEEATSSCIFRNVMNNAAGETAGVTQDVSSDPTVGDRSPSSGAELCGRRGSGSSRSSGSSGLSGMSSMSGISGSSRSSRLSDASTIVSCIGCGGMIVCESCGEHLAVLPADDGKLGLGMNEAALLGFDELVKVDEEDVEILPWTESISDLAEFMSRTQDFFGLEDMDVDMDGEPENDVLVAAAAAAAAQYQGPPLPRGFAL